jgi:hypothetical protein
MMWKDVDASNMWTNQRVPCGTLRLAKFGQGNKSLLGRMGMNP